MMTKPPLPLVCSSIASEAKRVGISLDKVRGTRRLLISVRVVAIRVEKERSYKSMIHMPPHARRVCLRVVSPLHERGAIWD